MLNNAKFNKKGQSIIEYSLIFVYVIIAVLVMGDYVKNSWHSRVKTLEQSANQSLSENLNGNVFSLNSD